MDVGILYGPAYFQVRTVMNIYNMPTSLPKKKKTSPYHPINPNPILQQISLRRLEVGLNQNQWNCQPETGETRLVGNFREVSSPIYQPVQVEGPSFPTSQPEKQALGQQFLGFSSMVHLDFLSCHRSSPCDLQSKKKTTGFLVKHKG